jgi:hypothetical protein
MNCKDSQTFDQSPFTINNADFIYTNDPYHLEIKGVLNTYDNSGYYADVTISFPEKFYEEINFLIDNEFIHDKTASVILILNFYNPTLDIIITIRVLYENMGGTFKKVVTQYNLIEISPQTDVYLVISLIFSIAFVINFVMMLKVSPNKESNRQNEVIIIDKGRCRKVRDMYRESVRYIKNNFRVPNKFEIMSKILSCLYIILQ